MHSDPGRAERCRQAAEGIGVVGELIAQTLGPAGRPAVISNQAGDDIEAPDAETIVAGFTPGNPRDSLGAGYIRDLVRDQHAAAGDGAATAVVLGHAMVRQAVAAVTVGADPVSLTHGIQAAANRVVDELGRRATDVRSKEEIAGVMAAAIFDRALADVLAEATDKVGMDGVITVEPAEPAEPAGPAGPAEPAEPAGTGAGSGLELALSQGISVDGGYVSPDFVTDADRGEAVLRDPCLLLVDAEVTAAEDLLPAIDAAAAAGRPLVVLAGGVTGAALDALLARGTRGTRSALAAWVSGDPYSRQAILADVAVVTGATVVGGSVVGGAAPQPASDARRSLGRAGKVVVTRDRTLIVDGAADDAVLLDRIRQYRRQIEWAETGAERQELFTRLAKLAGGAATVRVGGATSVQTARRIARAERGLAVARMAREYPIASGGGVALADVQHHLEKFPRSVHGRRGHDARYEVMGAQIVLDSLTAPMRQLAENAGMPSSAIEKALKSRKDGTGIDPATGKTVPMRPHAMDVLPVLQAAVANAASLTVRVLVG